MNGSMHGEDPFERDLRTGLRDLAAEGAPDRLVTRVASLPAEQVAPRSGYAVRSSLFRLAINLGAAAVLVVALGALILGRPGTTPPVGGQPSNGVSSPGGVGSPPASSPTSVPTALPSSPVAGGPTPPAGGSTPPAGGPVPVGFRPASATFVSPDEGWVLGTAPCSTAPCTSIIRTADGGTTWVGIPAPKTDLAAVPEPGVKGVSGLRFADPLDGWAFGPELWSTHDGGATWRAVSIPGLGAGTGVVALASANGTVHLAVYDGQAGYRIASSPVASDDWHLSPLQVPVGAGPVPTVQIVLSGSAGWLIEVDRTVVDGARLVGSEWMSWQPPCKDVVGPAVLAAASPTELVAACDVGLWGNPKGEHLFVSHDGGATFTETPVAVPSGGASQVASASVLVTVVAGTDSKGAALIATFDGGRTWTTVAQVGAVSFADLGFTTIAQGIVVTSSDAGANLLMTRDGGRTWLPARFSGT